MMHFDFQVGDLDEAVAEAVAIGATLATHQPQENVRVLFDPAGHPFCLCHDAEGGARNARARTRCRRTHTLASLRQPNLLTVGVTPSCRAPGRTACSSGWSCVSAGCPVRASVRPFW